MKLVSLIWKQADKNYEKSMDRITIITIPRKLQCHVA